MSVFNPLCMTLIYLFGAAQDVPGLQSQIFLCLRLSQILMLLIKHSPVNTFSFLMYLCQNEESEVIPV